MARKKRFKKSSDQPEKSEKTQSFTNEDIVEELEPIEVGWEFHKVPLILSVVIAVIFYVLVFIFVK